MYVFYYKKYFFWRKINVIGHKLDEEKNMMVLHTDGGGLQTIINWNKYSMKLKKDWVLAVKENLEKQTGIDVKLSV